jgi:hypothetical protein
MRKIGSKLITVTPTSLLEGETPKANLMRNLRVQLNKDVNSTISEFHIILTGKDIPLYRIRLNMQHQEYLSGKQETKLRFLVPKQYLR